MIYPNDFERKIGFTEVRNYLINYCLSADTRIHAEEMGFMTDFKSIKLKLHQVDEMQQSLTSGDDSMTLPIGMLPVESLNDLFNQLGVPGSHLSVEQLILLRKFMNCCNELHAFFTKDDHRSVFHHLYETSRNLTDNQEAVREIDRVVSKEGEIKSSASEQLSHIRRELSNIGNTVSSIMRRVMSKAIQNGSLATDATPVVREGRLVLPVSPMHKKAIGGIVHDESATGRTIYIEPAEVVEVNNRIRELELEEKREIISILCELTDWLRQYTEELKENHSIATELDFIRAKARYAINLNAQLPHLSSEPEIEWYHALHPILFQTLKNQGKETVALDITLTQKDRILIISGPNAGGKSVCLKTVGIVQYMFQCGMLPPLYSNSHMGIFKDLFIDIGDDQSIENDLSTYSSHIRNMKFFLQHGNGRSLILIDEFGGGTEPTIGGAIAQAILTELNKKKCWGVITTHYQNLKHLAEETDGLINGSMLYDRHLMQPLFTLSIGNAGSSFALEIARKTGLPDNIIKEATNIVGQDYVNTDKFLLDINRDKKYWERKRLDIHNKEKKLEETLEKWEEERNKLKEQRNSLIKEAKEKARQIISETNVVIERTIKEIKEHQAEKEATRRTRKELEEFKKRIEEEYFRETEPLLNKKTPNRKKKENKAKIESIEPKTLTVGDSVQLDGKGVTGEITEIKGRKATVNFGNIKTSVDLDRLTVSKTKPKNERMHMSTLAKESNESNHQRRMKFKNEIDVRGMRAEEAIQAVTYFIDDAIQFSAGTIRILHGTGTGALKQSIRQYLSTIPGVQKFMDEDVRMGGAGITVVELE